MWQQTGLLDFPAEIWVKIGRYAVNAEPYYELEEICAPDCLPFHHIEFDGVQWPHQPAITRTCRILREELLGYYYRTKIDFWLSLNPSERDYVRMFFKNIGAANRQHITEVWAEGKRGRPMGPSRKIGSHYLGDLPLRLVPVERTSRGEVFANGELYSVRFLGDEETV